MVLVDTTVVIVYLRTRDLRLFSLFQAHTAAVTGIVRAEVLSGVRSPAELLQTPIVLDTFVQVDFPHTLWDRVGSNRAALRSSGLSVPFNDVVLATLAIELGVEVWSRDRHFALMQRVLPSLKLFQEPKP